MAQEGDKRGGATDKLAEALKQLGAELDPEDQKDVTDADFQFALQTLLQAYKPLLESDLARLEAPEQLTKEALAAGPSCAEEFAAAEELLGKFFTDDVAIRLLPAQARELLGPLERWRWCLLHIRCCIIFGWLLCRRPHTFRSANYYLYWFWRCVRQAIGIPVGSVLDATQRADFGRLVQALAAAYKPFLSDQLASVEFSAGIPEDIIAGKLDCLEDDDASNVLFEQMLSPDAAAALLGEELFAKYRQEPWFWFCRCWCLCALRFGCCLARIRNLRDFVRCLLFYRRCLRQCFRPLTCTLSDPVGCVAEEVNVELRALVVAVHGTAAGAMFDHYVLAWSRDGIVWHNSDFHYPPIPPGAGVQGNSPVSGGLLAYLDTSALDPGFYFIRMTVFASSGATQVCTTQFSLFKQEVRILSVDGAALDTVWVDPNAKFVEAVPGICEDPPGVWQRFPSSAEMSFGDCLYIYGGAFVGGCDGKRIKRYLIDYKPGFETNCSSSGWSNIWKVEYNTVWQYRDMNMRKDTSNLTAVWDSDCIVPVPFPPYCLHTESQARLDPSCWSSHGGLCQLSGLITLRLTVEDTDGNTYCDTQRVWLDNKPVCAELRIDAVPKCQDLFVSKFADPPDCATPWNLPLSGIAYDQYIDDALPLTRPNDNFDYYQITVTKQGGAPLTIPISLGPTTPCFKGSERVGKCDPCNPVDAHAGDVYGTLAQFDLRAVDLLCKGGLPYAVPDEFTIARGSCCVYTFDLWVYDRTVRSSGLNWAHAVWPVKICNDLKP